MTRTLTLIKIAFITKPGVRIFYEQSHPGEVYIFKVKYIMFNPSYYEKEYRNKFPEKLIARNATHKIYASTGVCKHHWSYKKDHRKDIIRLTLSQHKIIHNNMIYDQSVFLHRTVGGVLIETKQQAIKYYEKILGENISNIY